MDTYTAGEVAEHLGVAPPTVRRTAERLHLRPTRTPGGHRRFTERQVGALVDTLGATPQVDDLAASEVKTLAALARHGLGLRSARAVARSSGLSPTTAGRCLDRLQRRELVEQIHTVGAEGRARDVTVWKLKVGPEWFRIAGAVARTIPPVAAPVPAPVRVPERLWHLFWNQDPARLRVSEHGAFIAGRLLASDDVAAMAWAVGNLPTENLEAATRQRGMDRRTVALVRNAIAARP